MNPAPVGIFDSGVGGLSVAREIRTHLPHEPLLYLADSAYCPYGGRPPEQLRARSLACVRELVDRGCKAIVVACNTATGAALELLRSEFDQPIVGLEPAVKPAAGATRNGRIGVMATHRTLASERFRRLVDAYASDVDVFPVACTGLVELVEAGETRNERALAHLSDLLQPLLGASVDTVVLGCTHYPFLSDQIATVLGPDVTLLDSGRAVARQLERVLAGARAPSVADQAEFRMLTSGSAGPVGEVAARLWGEPVAVESISVPRVLQACFQPAD